jgi:hypothetical protein
MNNLLNAILGDHEQMTKLFYTHLQHDNSYEFSWFSPYLGGGSVGNPMLALLSIHLRAGWGGECGWLGSPLFSGFANGRAGSGSRGQPLHMTIYTYLMPYTLCPQEFLSQI